MFLCVFLFLIQKTAPHRRRPENRKEKTKSEEWNQAITVEDSTTVRTSRSDPLPGLEPSCSGQPILGSGASSLGPVPYVASARFEHHPREADSHSLLYSNERQGCGLRDKCLVTIGSDSSKNRLNIERLYNSVSQ